MIKIQRFQFYELVTALVLILLLVALLLFAVQCRKPRVTKSNWFCSNIMKQLGSAAALYEVDNTGNFSGPQPQGSENALVSWDRPLAIQMGIELGINKIDEPLASLTRIPPHVASRSLDVFACPQDPRRPGARMVPLVPGSQADGMADGTGICRSYSLNLGSGNLAGKEDGIAASASMIPLKKIESASSTVYLIENHGYATAFGQRNIANDTTVACTKEGKMVPADAFTNPAAPMHGTKSRPRFNTLMYDGHVEMLEQFTVIANGGQIFRFLKEEAK